MFGRHPSWSMLPQNEDPMATSTEEIRAAFGEHLAFLVRSLDEGSDLHAAIATGLEALQAGSLS